MRLYPKILTRFLAKRFFGNFFAMLGIVIGITLTISFIENMTKSSASLSSAFIDSTLQILDWIPIFLPLVVFLSILLTTWKLTRNSEIPIIVGAGLSPMQWMRPFIYDAFIIGLVATTIVNPISVYSTRYFSSDKSENNEKILLLDNIIWIKETNMDKNLIIEATKINLHQDSLNLSNAIILQQDTNFKLLNRIESDSVSLSNGKWIANNSTIYDTDNHILHNQNWETTSSMKPNHIYERYLKSSQISFWELPSFIKNLSKTGFNTRSHELQLYTLLFQPFLLIAMVILGMAFSLTKKARNQSFGLKFGFGILTSFILYFFTNIFAALGTSGFLPPIISIITPPLIILFFSVVFILNFDNS